MPIKLFLLLLLIVVPVALLVMSSNSADVSVEFVTEPTIMSELIEHTDEELDFISKHRSDDVPDLPFDDNPDPTACGIPVVWGSNNNLAYLNGIYEGEMIQETVLLYDSHSRLEVVASAPHGTEVEILMFQDNPVMNYYKVRIPSAQKGENEGWIPAILISHEPLIND